MKKGKDLNKLNMNNHYAMNKCPTLITACVLTGGYAFARQALWGDGDTTSPQINPDHTVTFRIKASKAIKVEVQGDFLPPQKINTLFGITEGEGYTELTEGKDGVWKYTFATLPSEIYSYSFVVNGQKMNDPNNVYQVRDVASVTNIFLIPRGRADNYIVQDVPHGNLSKVWYNSPTLGMRQRRMTCLHSRQLHREQQEISCTLSASRNRWQ